MIRQAACAVTIICCACSNDGNLQAVPDILAKVTPYTVDRATWETRAAEVRRGILEGARLTAFPDRGPLNPILHSYRERDGYSVENVAIETLPGVFLTGNLYRPLEATARAPAILLPHGHFEQEEGFDARTAPEMQAWGGHLAKM